MKKLILLLPILLMACAKPDTPAQDIYLVESDYAVALRLEVAYDGLPRCGLKTSPKLCSSLPVMQKVRQIDNVAWDAIRNAETAVRTKGFSDSNVATAVASAKALVKTYTDITQTLGVK